MSRAAGVALATLLAVAILYPIIRLIGTALTLDGQPSSAHLEAFFNDSDVLAMTRNTFLLTLGGGLIATAFGTILAITTAVLPSHRVERRILQLVPLIPFTLPPLVGAVGWLFLLSPRVGWVNILLRQATGSSATDGPISVFSMPVLIWVTGLYVVPYVYTIMASSLSRLSTDLLESYEVCGCSSWGALMRAVAGPLKPALLAAVSLAVMHSLSQFSIPLILGQDVLTTHMYRQVTFLGDYAKAAAVGLPLLVVAIVLTVAQLQLTNQGGRRATVSGRGGGVRAYSLGPVKDRLLKTVAYLYMFVAGVAPVAAIALVSLLSFWRPSITWSDLRLGNYVEVWNTPLVQNGALTSLRLGVACALIATALAMLVIILVERSGDASSRWAYFFANLTLGVPLVLFGLAVLVAFIGPPIVLYGTIWILVLAYVVAFLPIAIRNLGPLFQQISRDLEEAARVSGATWGRTLQRITIPLVMPGLTASTALLFILMFREFSMAAFLSAPSTNVIAMAVLAFNDSGEWPYVAVVAVFLSAVSVIGLAIANVIASRFDIARPLVSVSGEGAGPGTR